MRMRAAAAGVSSMVAATLPVGGGGDEPSPAATERTCAGRIYAGRCRDPGSGGGSDERPSGWIRAAVAFSELHGGCDSGGGGADEPSPVCHGEDLRRPDLRRAVPRPRQRRWLRRTTFRLRSSGRRRACHGFVELKEKEWRW
ncbi:unnamed protein product [Urochloa humidicola]